MTLRLEDVGELSIEQASDWLDERNISYELLESHEEMLDLIRATLADIDINTEGQTANSEESMSDAVRHDCAMKNDLHKIYGSLQTFVKNKLGDELREHINTIYNDIDARLEGNIDDLINSENAIIVAGETSAGKSSFLNLLIGANVLPCSLLASTSAICQIHNSELKRFTVVNENEEKHTIDIIGEGSDAENDFIAKLTPFVGRSENETKDKIKHVDIYWPVPFIKGNVTIVDTPGVGESEEMTRKLVRYLPKAVAFIYIVNSANAGGIQEDTILKIIAEQRKLDTDSELSSFDPKNMVFICNKWDVVNKRGESDRTWLDTTQKLMRTIPGLTEDHIFKLSVTEAVKYKKSGIGNTTMYQHLLGALDQFIQDSLMANIRRHYRWISILLAKIEVYLVSRINNAKKSSEEKHILQQLVMLRLLKLEKDSEKVRVKLIETARKECHFVTQQLYKHLKKDEVISFLNTWTEEESPDIVDNDLDVTRFKAKDMILQRLLDVIQTWESETRIVERATQKLTNLFNEECLVISHNCREVNEILKGGFSDRGGQILGGSTPVDPGPGLETSDIVIIVATAPIWIPIGAAALAILTPIGIGASIYSGIKNALKRKEYRKNKAIFMKRWTHMLLEDLHKIENISNLIEGIYLKGMTERIYLLCSTFLPKQIEADRAQMRKILGDKRTAHQIIQQFRPKKEEMKGIFTSLYLFDLKYLAVDVIDISKILRYRQIGGGSFSDVYRASWRQSNGNENEVALKILKGHDIYLQLSEIDCSRRLKHNNIVEFYGVIFAGRERYYGRLGFQREDIGLPLYDDRLMLVQELCDQSLESLVFGTKDRQCGSFSSDMRLRETQEFFFNMCASICKGLNYMHGMGYLHRDLKLSNVLVKDDVGKLSDLGFARAEAVVTGTAVGTLSHMAPELFDNKLYSYSSDVYSLGILMWELWYGALSYSDVNFAGFGVGQFIDGVKLGKRPGCEKEHKMMPELIILVKRCWSQDASKRPNVEKVASELREINNKYLKDVSR